MIAALFVATGGCYFGLDGVDPWDVTRNARTYAGPHPVVAHPPCERWGRYAEGGPNPKAARRIIGDDGGCFEAALASVRRCGGVLEHPEASHAWSRHGLTAPPKDGGWVRADFVGGWTCCVEQGHYGHRARKATWLYAFGVELPSLKWGPSGATCRLDLGFHSKEERERYASGRVRARVGDCERMGKRERAATPVAFRDVLLSIARSAVRP